MYIFIPRTIFNCSKRRYSTMQGQRERKLLLTGHRGAPKFFPEHTLASYGAAIREGMDLVEPDVVISKEGTLICLHDIDLSTITNVAEKQEFASRKRPITVGNGEAKEGWAVSDFTVEELKSLRVRHRHQGPLREHFAEDFYQIVTLEELFAFVQQRNKEIGTSAGVHIEIKNTPFFNALGLRFEKPLVDLLVKYGYEIHDSKKARETPILIQSFDVCVLKSLRFDYGVQLRLGQLVNGPGKVLEEDFSREYSQMLTAEGLDEIATYADSVNPQKHYFYECAKDFMARINPGVFVGSKLCDEAHKRGLALHTWTVRSKLEDPLQVEHFEGSAYVETMRLFELGLDGVITESPVESYLARQHFLDRKKTQSVTMTPKDGENHSAAEGRSWFMHPAASFLLGASLAAAFLLGKKM